MPRIHPDILEAALAGLEAQKENIETFIAELKAALGRPAQAYTSRWSLSSKTRKRGSTRRALSPESRKRIAAAQKKRWAAFRKNQKSSS